MSELKARWIVSKVNRTPELNIAGWETPEQNGSFTWRFIELVGFSSTPSSTQKTSFAGIAPAIATITFPI